MERTRFLEDTSLQFIKGKEKAIKTIKVTGNANAKTAKMPKKKGTYYIRISKLTKKTNGTYEIGYY